MLFTRSYHEARGMDLKTETALHAGFFFGFRQGRKEKKSQIRLKSVKNKIGQEQVNRPKTRLR